MVSAYNGPTLACVCVGEWEEALLYSRQKEDEEECWEIGLFGFTRTHCWAQTDRHTGCDFNKQAAAATAADAVFLIRLYTTSSSVGTSIETSEHSILMYIYIYSDTERTKSGVVFRRHCAAYRIIEIQLSAGNQSIHLRDIIGLLSPLLWSISSFMLFIHCVCRREIRRCFRRILQLIIMCRKRERLDDGECHSSTGCWSPAFQ